MTDFRRYALYFAPRPGTALAQLGAGWFGHDAETGLECARPDLQSMPSDMLNIITAQAARYGFHGTLKAPFFLAKPHSFDGLLDVVRTLAGAVPPVDVPPLLFGRLDGFFALHPRTRSAELQEFAQTCVETLDRFRATLSDEERARRLASGLSERQADLLDRWGYPYVEEEFRFHLTLTGRLDDVAAEVVSPVLEQLVAPCLEQPLVLEDICVFGEPDPAARFRLLDRVPLTGSSA